jgi:hypothetical protein
MPVSSIAAFMASTPHPTAPLSRPNAPDSRFRLWQMQDGSHWGVWSVSRQIRYGLDDSCTASILQSIVGWDWTESGEQLFAQTHGDMVSIAGGILQFWGHCHSSLRFRGSYIA